MRRWIAELVALPILPFLIAQGRRTRRITPRLPEASGPTSGIINSDGSTLPLSLLALGESPVAGVGVSTHEEAVTGHFAWMLAHYLKRSVSWHALGKNGITVREAQEHLLPLIPDRQVDIILIAFGVNDTTSFRPVHRWQRDLERLIHAVLHRCRPKVLLLSGVPPVGSFPALPHPLKWVMGLKARALDRSAQELAARIPSAIYVPLNLETCDPEMMASDGFHPSSKGCAAWAALLEAASRDALLKQC